MSVLFLNSVWWRFEWNHQLMIFLFEAWLRKLIIDIALIYRIIEWQIQSVSLWPPQKKVVVLEFPYKKTNAVPLSVSKECKFSALKKPAQKSFNLKKVLPFKNHLNKKFFLLGCNHNWDSSSCWKRFTYFNWNGEHSQLH